MRASEFFAANAGKALSAWESSAVKLAQSGREQNYVPLTYFPVDVTTRDGKHTGQIFVANDYLALGSPTDADYLRLPLTPISAQRIVDAHGAVLPTSKMVDDIWKASTIKLFPVPLVPNKGANLAQYQEHSRAIDDQLRALYPQIVSPITGTKQLTSGQKKDVILSNIWKPGKVVIYGWHRPDGTRIQPKSNVHGDFYVDYSHGIRLVSPDMVVDGQPMKTTDVMQSKELSPLVSDEGPLKQVRYPGSVQPLSYYQVGTNILLAFGTNAITRKSA